MTNNDGGGVGIFVFGMRTRRERNVCSIIYNMEWDDAPTEKTGHKEAGNYVCKSEEEHAHAQSE